MSLNLLSIVNLFLLLDLSTSALCTLKLLLDTNLELHLLFFHHMSLLISNNDS